MIISGLLKMCIPVYRSLCTSTYRDLCIYPYHKVCKSPCFLHGSRVSPLELPGIITHQAFRRIECSKGCDRSHLTDITNSLRIKAKDIGMAEHLLFELQVVGIDSRDQRQPFFWSLLPYE